METSPTAEEWKALFVAASEFKSASPWEWMWDSDLFGVQNPETGEIGYCCIMGKSGQHFALALYPGAEGLKTHHDLQSGKICGSFQVFASQKCLMASFKDRNMLSDRDLELIKRLGLTFRGRNAWPLFRDFAPGYMPWYLTSEQARFLTLALQQAVNVSLQAKENHDILDPPTENVCLVRVPQEDEKDHGVRWVDEWRAFPPLEHLKASGEIRIPPERVRALAAFQHKGTWEVGLFYTPTPVGEKGERPYIPYTILWVDHALGFILHTELTKAEECEAALVEESLKAMERLKRVPEKVLIEREKEEVVRLIEGVASQLGIKVVQVKRLRELERARESLISHFSIR